MIMAVTAALSNVKFGGLPIVRPRCAQKTFAREKPASSSSMNSPASGG